MTEAMIDRLRELLRAATPILDGSYAVDAEGRVFSTTRWRGHDVRQLAPSDDGDGYLRVRLTIEGRRHNAAVHRLICAAFHGPKPTSFHEVRHLNGNKLDNRAENLAWGTRQDNADDRERHGRTARGDQNGARLHPERLARGDQNASRLRPDRVPRGERVGSAKLTEAKVRYLRTEVARGRTATEVGAELGITFGAACRVIRGETWRHVA